MLGTDSQLSLLLTWLVVVGVCDLEDGVYLRFFCVLASQVISYYMQVT